MDKALSALQKIESRYEGKLHIAATSLTSGKTRLLRENEPVSTASTIKLPILIHAAMCVSEGTASWDQSVTMQNSDKVGGMGVLRNMDVPLTLTLKDACYLMTAISDNTATNLVIDVFGKEAINSRIKQLGMTNTRLNRKAFSPETESSRPFGLGQTTANDFLKLLKIIYAPENISDSDVPLEVRPDADAITSVKTMLSQQQDLVAIARALPPGWTYAGKTGRIETLRADVGIVTAPDCETWLMAIYCFGLKTEDWSIQNQGLLSIGEAVKVITGQAN